MVRARFAPSPTGSLHLGNARVAALNWLFARRAGGRFVLRIEDTDVDRNIEGADAALLADLRWLGLHWDEGPREDGSDTGPHAPYHQSRRTTLYARRAGELRERGVVYPCFCSDEELAARRALALAAGGSPHYDRRCVSLPPAEVARLEAAGAPCTLRFRVPDRGTVVVRDVIRGDIGFDMSALGDFVVLRSDGRPTYNFAVVVDDIDMEISDVIRGSGHLSNTPRQVLLFEALDAPTPRFAHVPSVLGPDRQKLSKRHGANALAEYRAEGYHPDGVLNYLSLLSWSSPSGEDVLGRDDLVREVTLARMGSADVIFDPVKLRWLSGKHIERMPLAALVEAVRPFLDASRVTVADAMLPVAVAAIRSHLTTFGEINEQLAAFRLTPPAAPPDGARPVLTAVVRTLESVAGWDEATVAAALKEGGAAAGVTGKGLYAPVRQALTRSEHGPPLAAVIVVNGRERVLAHLRSVLGAE